VKNNILVKNPVVAYLPKNFLKIKENLSQTERLFNFNAIGVWQTCHDPF
jgi:hypothetical protein